MPIRRENRALYPQDWTAISARIRARAGDRCEACGVRNGQLGGRLRNGRFLHALPLDYTHGPMPQPGDWHWCAGGDPDERGAAFLRIVRIVLTVAHLNHRPEDCRPENLRALCQRCHNRLDAKARAAGVRARARAALGVEELPLEPRRRT